MLYSHVRIKALNFVLAYKQVIILVLCYRNLKKGFKKNRYQKRLLGGVFDYV